MRDTDSASGSLGPESGVEAARGMPPAPDTIPVFRPRLPTAEEVLPYLKRIDASRWYTNHGPLNREFECRLAALFGLPETCVVTSSNGTAALVQALRALGAAPGRLCLTPSWTFAATPASIMAAGLTPFFVDVDRDTWRLELAMAEARLDVGEVGAVMPVSPFGAPIDGAGWDGFHQRTGIPVVIDGAAAFDSYSRSGRQIIGDTPVIISLHATKVFGVGEGAFVLTRDAELAQRIRQFGNFGFYDSRQATVPGVNAKLSEYGAAVGLAGLDSWQSVRAEWEALTICYRAEIERAELLRPGVALQGDWVSSYGVVELPAEMAANDLAEALSDRGIETRRWWDSGCHAQLAYRDCPRVDLPNTEYLAEHMLGLPFWRGLDEAGVRGIFETLRAAMRDLRP